MSAMRQQFPLPKPGSNAQTNNSSEFTSYKIDPNAMFAPQSRPNTSVDQVKSSSKPDVNIKHAKETQNASWNASGARSSNNVRQTSAQTPKTRFSEPARPNGASFQRRAKSVSKSAGMYAPDADVNQHKESTTSSRPVKALLAPNEMDAGKHEHTSNDPNTSRKRSRQSLEGAKDISNYRNVVHDTRNRTPEPNTPEHAPKRRQNSHSTTGGVALQSISQKIVPTEIPDSDAPLSPQSSSEEFFDDANDNSEEDDMFSASRSLKRTGSSFQDTGTNFTEGTVELAATEGRPNSSSVSRYDVIDLHSDQSNNAQQYQTPSLYIHKKVAWEVSRAAVPNDLQKIAGWENLGQSIAKRAAHLVSEYISHRRNRANLFDRVQKRIADHKRHLGKRETALANKLTTVSSQCESLIQEVKTGST